MLGNHTKSFDQKNRVIIPAKFREKLGNPFYITLGPDNTCELRAAHDFNVWKDKLLANNMLNQNARNFARVLFGNAYECNFDEMGRVILPINLLTMISITTEITFVGVGNKIELWNPTAYKKFLAANSGEKSLEEMAKKLFKDGAAY